MKKAPKTPKVVSPSSTKRERKSHQPPKPIDGMLTPFAPLRYEWWRNIGTPDYGPPPYAPPKWPK
jgi:hypothetical protein